MGVGQNLWNPRGMKIQKNPSDFCTAGYRDFQPTGLYLMAMSNFEKFENHPRLQDQLQLVFGWLKCRECETGSRDDHLETGPRGSPRNGIQWYPGIPWIAGPGGRRVGRERWVRMPSRSWSLSWSFWNDNWMVTIHSCCRTVGWTRNKNPCLTQEFLHESMMGMFPTDIDRNSTTVDVLHVASAMPGWCPDHFQRV